MAAQSALDPSPRLPGHALVLDLPVAPAAHLPAPHLGRPAPGGDPRHRPARLDRPGVGVRAAARDPRAPLGSARPAATPGDGRGARPVCHRRGARGPGAAPCRWPRPRTPPWTGRPAQSDAADSPDCRGEPISGCTIREGDGLNVVLVGDSLVRVWQSAFEVIAEERDMTLSVLWLGGCSWHRDVQVVVAVKRQQTCFAAQADWFDRAIPELDPDLVVLAHRGDLRPGPTLPRQPRPLPGRHRRHRVRPARRGTRGRDPGARPDRPRGE